MHSDLAQKSLCHKNVPQTLCATFHTANGTDCLLLGSLFLRQELMAQLRLLELCTLSSALGWNQGALGSTCTSGRLVPAPPPSRSGCMAAVCEGSVLSTQEHRDHLGHSEAVRRTRDTVSGEGGSTWLQKCAELQTSGRTCPLYKLHLPAQPAGSE